MNKKTPFRSSKAHDSSIEPSLLRLEERSDFPKRVRDILKGALALCSSSLEPRLDECLTEFEKQLIRLADKAPNQLQNSYFDSVHEVRRGRSAIPLRFLSSIENSLALLGTGVTHAQPTPQPTKLRLALTEGEQLDESLVLNDMATKVELRIREPLYALGTRFGVLAAAPRIPTEIMPLGPRSIVDALRYATSVVNLVLEHRLVLYRCFERVALIRIASFYNALNDYLVEQGILRHLHKLVSHPDQARASSGEVAGRSPGTTTEPIHAAAQHASVIAATPAGSSLAKNTDERQATQPDDQVDFFNTLRALLGECRRVESYAATGEDLQGILAALQTRHGAAATGEDKQVLRSGDQIKQEVLAVLRELSADGRAPRLNEEDCDTIDLIAMLFEFLSHRAPADGMTQHILIKLQMPILRVALKDKSFFSNTTHPARQALGQLVEFSRYWVDEADSSSDAALVTKLQALASQIASKYQGGAAVFSEALQALSEYTDAILQNVKLAERRHVEAACGRERLERARLQATEAISTRIASSKPNEFLRMLLEQAWVDVLAVSLLRDGEDSDAYRRRLDVVEQLLAASTGSEIEPASQEELRVELEAGLVQVGLHDDDVKAIGQKLFADFVNQDDDPISQTELAIKLRGKAKLGQKPELPTASIRNAGEPPRAPLTPSQQAALERIRSLPPGTWFEFVTNEQGDVVRRKLAWYSTLDDRCLFINQRGVPTEGQTLTELACQVADESARPASVEEELLLDRALSTIAETLKYFSMHKLDNYFGVPSLADRAQGIHRQHLAPQETSQPEQQPRTLLLVDDEKNILRALTRVLRAEGYQIHIATSASEGLEVLRHHQVQVIVCDQRMPHVSGIQFLSEVKATYSDTVRIMLSGYSDAAAVTDAINRGTIYKFLTKPWNDEDIRLQVRDAFIAYEAREQADPASHKPLRPLPTKR